MTTGVRIVFTGQIWPGANSSYLADAFQQCGAIVHWINDTNLYPGWQQRFGRVLRQLIRPVIEREWNTQLIQAVENIRPDLVYVTNSDFCLPETLDRIRQLSIPIMCFYHDPPWKNIPGNRFSQNIKLFDLIASTRKWHKEEFLANGAQAVEIVRFGFNSDVHRPIKVDSHTKNFYGSNTVFIGTSRSQRTSDLTSLITSDENYDLKIWGGGWDRLPKSSKIRSCWQGRTVNEQEIAIIYASTKAALHWVNWEAKGKNPDLQKGDQHNSRTFQLAACGGAVMIAQRTDEHMQYFRENEEVILFDDVEELRVKLQYWLAPAQDSKREQVAKAARKRCLQEDYTYIPVVQRFLNYFNLPTLQRYGALRGKIV